MKRHSKLLPETFVKAMSLGILDSKNITEEVITEKCANIQDSVSLSKQAFSLIYANALESHQSLLLNYFSDVKLLDAITISLADQVSDDYVGMGGRNAKSALKIQTLYSAIHHSITEFDITSGVTHDTNILSKVIHKLTERELFLADLGHFDTDSLCQVQEKTFSSAVSKRQLYKMMVLISVILSISFYTGTL